MSKYLIANWKANKDYSQTQLWIKNFKNQLIANSAQDKLNQAEWQVILAPSFPLLWPAAMALHREELKVQLATQDLSHQTAGSFTGSVAADNLKGLSISYVILGHSERRRFFAETDEQVAQKVKLALQAGYTPVLCLDVEYLDTQAALLSPAERQACVVAYEPWGAISTATANAQSANPQEILPVLNQIKQVYQPKAVIYGGSVDENNINDYLAICDGALIGSASLDEAKFAKLLAQAS